VGFHLEVSLGDIRYPKHVVLIKPVGRHLYWLGLNTTGAEDLDKVSADNSICLGFYCLPLQQCA